MITGSESEGPEIVMEEEKSNSGTHDQVSLQRLALRSRECSKESYKGVSKDERRQHLSVDL